jgi:hypothetical protein
MNRRGFMAAITAVLAGKYQRTGWWDPFYRPANVVTYNCTHMYDRKSDTWYTQQLTVYESPQITRVTA